MDSSRLSSFSNRFGRSRQQSFEPFVVRPQTGREIIQPASPEVISSLITSLSAISSEAESHFDRIIDEEDLSRYTASNPSLSRSYYKQSSRDNSQQTGFGVDYGAYKTPQVDDTDDADAAIPPVVRMTKPKPPSPASNPSRKLSFRRSTSSLRSPSQESVSQPAPLNLEVSPSRPPRSPVSPNGWTRRLTKRASKDSMASIETTETKQGYLGDNLVSATSAPNGRSLRSTPSSRSLVEGRIDAAIAEAETPSTKRESPAPIDTNSKPSADNSSPESRNAISPGGIGSGRFIPSRQSSLRHSYSGSPAKPKGRSVRHSRHSMGASKDLKVDNDLPEEDDEVVRRIRELQAAKQKRDQEFQAENVETSRRSRPRSDQPSPVPVSEPQRLKTRRSLGSLTELMHRNGGNIEEEEEDAAPAPSVATGKRSSQKAQNPLSSTSGNAQLQVGKRSDGKTSSRSNSVRSKHRNGGNSPIGRSSSYREPKRNSGTLSPTRTSFAEARPSTSDSIDDAVDAYMTSPRLTQKVKHPQSGRVIAFSEVGDPNGFAVICCVGMGLTRYLTAFYDELARTLRLRLITPDRPGVGESEPCQDGSGTPLAWPDDVAIICNHLKVTKFSLLAHSAGAIYALATALRMPQHIRGRIHLLAPWIPPSQMSIIHREPLPSGAVPYSQKILRALPTSFLKAANSSFMSATSASITSSLPKSPRKSTKRRSTISADTLTSHTKSANASTNDTMNKENAAPNTTAAANASDATPSATSPPVLDPRIHQNLDQYQMEREQDYDERLTQSIWTLATFNSNPALDLVTCLERRRPIGFSYVDITRAVVIHHGTRDTRVPVENVKWLGRVMRRCEVRILEGEGHGLMAVAKVMSNVLGEVAKEWEDWDRVTQGKREKKGADRAAGERGMRERTESFVSRYRDRDNH